MSSSNYFRSWIDRSHLDPNTRLLTEEYQRVGSKEEGTFGRFGSSLPVDGGSTGGLGGTEEAEPANDGDDAEDVPKRGVPERARPTNISSEYTEGLLPRNIPRDSFLGIFRGLRSSEIPDGNSEEHFVGTSEDWTIGKSIEISRGSFPSVYSEDLSDELVVFGVSLEIHFLGIPSEISEGFPRSYFRGITLFRRHTDDFFPRYAAVFL
ncbi:hypothetical protein F2Q69_00016404 [Brassica cretica]|uniref:Uncharacterized protein n=1 Tax=Brassica cretica TaxID=69181 RepID=A0A8S9R9R1_BRACR|nr:hypothetical protein F2Q69_00016404 [Brassica cretica]